MIRSVVAVLLVALVTGQGFQQPPSVTLHPKVDLLIRDSTADVQFRCTASGIPQPVISWYKDDKPVESHNNIEFQSDGSLRIKSMEKIFEGRYQCKAKNDHGVAQSNTTNLKMAFFGAFPIPNVIPTKAEDERKSTVLACNYDPNVPLSYPPATWARVTQNTQPTPGVTPQQSELTLNDRLSIDDMGNLYIQHLELRDQDLIYYLCEGWNPVMGVKKSGSPTLLKVRPVTGNPTYGAEIKYPVEKTSEASPKQVEVIAGEDIVLYCIFSGYPSVTVKWEKLNTNNPPFFEYENGKTKLIIKKSENTDKFEGLYRCQGTQGDRNDDPNASAVYNVSVLQKPRFIKGPVNVNITHGKNVTIQCLTEAEPKAEITWYINGVESSQVQPPDLRRNIDTTTNTYTFTKLRKSNDPSKSDLHVVSCMARNVNPKTGEEIGRSYMDGYVNVVSAMEFAKKPVGDNVTEETEVVQLDCDVTSDPGIDPTISWHHDDVPVTTIPDKIVIHPNHSLFIYPQAYDDFNEVLGTYVCIAQTFAPPERIQANATLTRKGGVIPVTAAGINLWWIGLVLALIILLIIIILICCCIKRRGTGETHDVDKVERQMGNDPVKDLRANGFKDYVPKEKAPIDGMRAREIEDFSLDAMDNEGYDEDNDSLEQYGQDTYPGEYGVGPRGRQNPGYYPDEGGYADPGYGGPTFAGNPNTGYLPDETDI